MNYKNKLANWKGAGGKVQRMCSGNRITSRYGVEISRVAFDHMVVGSADWVRYVNLKPVKPPEPVDFEAKYLKALKERNDFEFTNRALERTNKHLRRQLCSMEIVHEFYVSRLQYVKEENERLTVKEENIPF